MEFGLGAYAIAFAAGGLSTLSPCVLPLLPIVVGSALADHPRGPWALASGLALAFALLGTVVAGIGATLGVDSTSFRLVAAALLVLFGALLLSLEWQARFATALSGLSDLGQRLSARVSVAGLRGQFCLGLLLGIVWTPCVGPTLGAAVALASQGQQLVRVGGVMLLFGLGAGLPLAILGTLTRNGMLRLRSRLALAGHLGKKVLGGVLLVLGVLILTGMDKRFEAWALDLAPPWLTELGIRL